MTENGKRDRFRSFVFKKMTGKFTMPKMSVKKYITLIRRLVLETKMETEK